MQAGLLRPGPYLRGAQGEGSKGDMLGAGLANERFPSVKAVFTSKCKSQEMEVCHNIRYHHLNRLIWYTKMHNFR